MKFYALGIILLIIISWSCRHIIKPYIEKKRLSRYFLGHPELKEALDKEKIFTLLFQNVNAASVSRKDRENLKIDSDDFIYGEVEFLSFFYMLKAINLSRKDIFYDLGSGAGKAVFIAALCFDVEKACGVELLPGLYHLANQQKEKLAALLPENTLSIIPRINFIKSNMTDAYIQDATVVFINATCLNYAVFDAVVQKLKNLPAGVRIIMTSKKLKDPLFETLFESRYLMSWGMNSVHAYIKKY